MDPNTWKAVGSPTREKNLTRMSVPNDARYADQTTFGLGLDASRQTSIAMRQAYNRASTGSPTVLPVAPKTPQAIPETDEEAEMPQTFSLWNTTAPPASQLASYQLPLKDESGYDLNLLADSAKQRSRSKSSSAAYGLQFDQLPLLSPDTIWSQQPQDLTHLIHRRSSTTPSYNPLWGDPPGMGTTSPAPGLSNGAPGLTNTHLSAMGVSPGLAVSPGKIRTSLSPYEGMEPPMSGSLLPSPDLLERYRQQRRFSHAPQIFYNDYGSYMTPDMGLTPVALPDGRRRHSLAGPLLTSPHFLAEGFEELGLHGIEEGPEGMPHPKNSLMKNIDDYFENTEHRARAWMEAGKNLQQFQQPSAMWPLLVVEFKAGRRDFFYVDDGKGQVKIGDLVIVEADRGKDLGKVVYDKIMSEAELKEYRLKHPDVLQSEQGGPSTKQVVPKRIYRLATAPEISLLVQKSQDEVKAMNLCVQKIRQHKLSMEVVDAEYQWDRRKLTFYFVSERRIDFRELVRDLFKIYKTRIWMCAVNGNPLQE